MNRRHWLFFCATLAWLCAGAAGHAASDTLPALQSRLAATSPGSLKPNGV